MAGHGADHHVLKGTTAAGSQGRTVAMARCCLVHPMSRTLSRVLREVSARVCKRVLCERLAASCAELFTGLFAYRRSLRACCCKNKPNSQIHKSKSSAFRMSNGVYETSCDFRVRADKNLQGALRNKICLIRLCTYRSPNEGSDVEDLEYKSHLHKLLSLGSRIWCRRCVASARKKLLSKDSHMHFGFLSYLMKQRSSPSMAR